MWHSSGPASADWKTVARRSRSLFFFFLARMCASVERNIARGRRCVPRAKLPKKRRKLDCLYYSPFAFDKYGCKCKTGSGSARPETRFIHIHPARARCWCDVSREISSITTVTFNQQRTYVSGPVRMGRAHTRTRFYPYGCLPSRIFSEIFYARFLRIIRIIPFSNGIYLFR